MCGILESFAEFAEFADFCSVAGGVPKIFWSFHTFLTHLKFLNFDPQFCKIFGGVLAFWGAWSRAALSVNTPPGLEGGNASSAQRGPRRETIGGLALFTLRTFVMRVCI